MTAGMEESDPPARSSAAAASRVRSARTGTDDPALLLNPGHPVPPSMPLKNGGLNGEWQMGKWKRAARRPAFAILHYHLPCRMRFSAVLLSI
jgi:hypothetical protein